MCFVSEIVARYEWAEENGGAMHIYRKENCDVLFLIFLLGVGEGWWYHHISTIGA